MTPKTFLAAVIGAWQSAFVAARVVSTSATQKHRCIAAPIAQQDDLISLIQNLPDLFLQAVGEVNFPWTTGCVLLPKVDQNAFGEQAVSDPVKQVEPLHLADLDIESRLQAGGRRSQNGDRRRSMGPEQRQIPPVIAGHRVLLVG